MKYRAALPLLLAISCVEIEPESCGDECHFACETSYEACLPDGSEVDTFEVFEHCRRAYETCYRSCGGSQTDPRGS